MKAEIVFYRDFYSLTRIHFLKQHRLLWFWERNNWKKVSYLVVKSCPLVWYHCASQICKESNFLKHNFDRYDISLSTKFNIAGVMPGHLFFLLVWWMWVGDRQELRSPKRHSCNNIRPFWINAMLEFWETVTEAWNTLNRNITWWRTSNVLHLVDD